MDTTIVVIEDDHAIRLSIASALRAEGHTVVALEDGRALGDHLDAVHLAIVDIDLPAGPNGLELTRQIRAAGDLPVIILTAAGDLEHKGEGYRAGADQYIAKPFSITELIWRVEALLRRSGRLDSRAIQAGPITIDPDRHTARFGDDELDLTPTEFALLQALARHRGRVLSKIQLLDLVWGHTGHDPNLVETTVRRLRAKLAAHDPALVDTVRGVGYRLNG